MPAAKKLPKIEPLVQAPPSSVFDPGRRAAAERIANILNQFDLTGTKVNAPDIVPSEEQAIEQFSEKIRTTPNPISDLAKQLKQVKVKKDFPIYGDNAPLFAPSEQQTELSVMQLFKNAGKDFKEMYSGLSTLMGHAARAGWDLMKPDDILNPFKKLVELPAASAGEAVGKLLNKEERAKAKDQVKIMATVAADMVKPWASLLKGDGKEFAKYVYDHPVYFLNDASVILSGGSLATGRVATSLARAAEVAGKTSKTAATLSKASKALSTVSSALQPERVILETVKFPGKALVKATPETLERAGKAAPLLLGAQTQLKKLQTFNPEVRKLRLFLRQLDNDDVAKQFARGAEISETLSPLNPEQIGAVVEALEGTIEPGMRAAFTPEMKGAFNKLREISLADEVFAKEMRLFSDEVMERRRYLPVMAKTGLDLKGAKNLFPADESPVYWRHLFASDEKAKWSDFLGVGRPLSLPQAKRLTEAELSFAKSATGAEGYITDNAKIFVLSGMQRSRIQNAIEKADRIAKEFGEALLPGNKLKEGYVSFNPSVYRNLLTDSMEATDDAVRVIGEGGTHVNEVISKGGRAFYAKKAASLSAFPRHPLSGTVQIPEAVAREIFGSKLSQRLDDLFGGKIRTTFDWWRLAALPLNPKWNINNFVGNAILTTLAGTKPSAYLKATQKKYRDLVPEMVLAGMARDEAEIMSKHVRIHSTIPEEVAAFMEASLNEARDASRAKGLIHKVADASFTMNTAVDDVSRTAVYLSEFEKQASKTRLLGVNKQFATTYDALRALNSAAPSEELLKASQKAIDKALFFFADYTALGPIERSLARNGIVPFYAWIKHINRLALTLPVRYPGRATLLRYLSNVAWETQEEELFKHGIDIDDLPFYLKGETVLGKDPKTGAFKVISAPSANPFNNLLAGGENIPISPLASTIIEALSGTDLFTKRKIVLDGEFYDPKSGEIATVDGYGRVVKVEQGTPGRALRILLKSSLESVPHVGVLKNLVTGGARLIPGLRPLVGADKIVNPYTGRFRPDSDILAVVGKFLGSPIKERDLMSIANIEKRQQKSLQRAWRRKLLREINAKRLLDDLDKEESQE